MFSLIGVKFSDLDTISQNLVLLISFLVTVIIVMNIYGRIKSFMKPKKKKPAAATNEGAGSSERATSPNKVNKDMSKDEKMSEDIKKDN